MPKETAAAGAERNVESASPATGSSRERSTIEFPYLDLNDAENLAKSVHTVGGTGCLIEQLAGSLKVVANGGGFRLRLLTARLFGLLTYDRTNVSLTALGQRICDQRQEAAARADAFLAIPLYEKVYEQYRGTVLPGNAGLENSMVALGVAPKQKVKARQAFQRSATQAGFFANGTDRLVMPSVRAGNSGSQSIGEEPVKREEEGSNGRNGGNSGPGGGSGYHPFIEGLLDSLPTPKSPWPIDARRKWLQTASGIFDLIYSDPSNEGSSLRVEIDKGSA